MYLTNQLYLHGGIEKMLSQKINHWIADYGYEVLLCSSEQRKNKFVYTVNDKLNHIDLGINYFRELSYFHPKNLFKSFYHFTALKKLIKQEKPDVIVSVNYTPEQFFLPFINKNIPKVKEFHSSGFTFKKPTAFIDKLKYQLFLLFDKYHVKVVLNEDEKKYYPFSQLYVIPNFVEDNKITLPLNKEKTIISAGRISQVKQFDHLIQAWSLIANYFPDWQVKIFGDGDAQLLVKLESLIKELKVPNIHLMGATSTLENEMQKAAIYALTSETECFPMVLLEAQAAELTIISYDCPNGPRNIIKPNLDGVLTPQNDVKVFADKLSMLIKNEVYREELGSTAKINGKRFSSKKVMEQWNELFLTLQTRLYD
jgi:glycosyltransferase involved in cell wall biosynthesis